MGGGRLWEGFCKLNRMGRQASDELTWVLGKWDALRASGPRNSETTGASCLCRDLGSEGPRLPGVPSPQPCHFWALGWVLSRYVKTRSYITRHLLHNKHSERELEAS